MICPKNNCFDFYLNLKYSNFKDVKYSSGQKMNNFIFDTRFSEMVGPITKDIKCHTYYVSYSYSQA